MVFHIITLFPEIFPPVLGSSIVGRAQKRNLVKFNYINPRDFVDGNYKSVDDKPYGGGAGMVMKAEPIYKALKSIKGKPYKILLSASGKKFDQKMANKLKSKKAIALVCGHYEGVDARVEEFVDEVVSVGDFVLTCGEIPALSIIDSVSRLLPNVINLNSLEKESFSNSQLEAPQYTRPETFKGLSVPKVLLGGDPKQVEKWQEEESKKRTKKFRPDLIS